MRKETVVTPNYMCVFDFHRQLLARWGYQIVECTITRGQKVFFLFSHINMLFSPSMPGCNGSKGEREREREKARKTEEILLAFQFDVGLSVTRNELFHFWFVLDERNKQVLIRTNFDHCYGLLRAHLSLVNTTLRSFSSLFYSSFCSIDSPLGIRAEEEPPRLRLASRRSREREREDEEQRRPLFGRGRTKTWPLAFFSVRSNCFIVILRSENTHSSLFFVIKDDDDNENN